MNTVKYEDLNLRKVMILMGVIMFVWAMAWYPFEYFLFPESRGAELGAFIDFGRECVRVAPAICFFVYYKDAVSVNLKELFSFKFDYKVFFTIAFSFLIYFAGVSYFKNSAVQFNSEKMGLYDAAYWLCLALCQELVFRGWSYHSFKKVVSEKNAVLLSSIFFAVSHWFAYFWKFYVYSAFDGAEFFRTTLFTFVFGVGMCLIPIKTKCKSIVPCVILHSLWNFLSFCY